MNKFYLNWQKWEKDQKSIKTKNQNILSNEDKYEKQFMFLQTDFEYYLVKKDIEHGFFYSMWEFNSNIKDYPKIVIEIEKANLNFYIYLNDNEFYELSLIYKFLNLKEIIRCDYNNYKTFKKYFVDDMRKYLKEFFKRKNEVDIKKIRAFYRQFPYYIFKWL